MCKSDNLMAPLLFYFWTGHYDTIPLNNFNRHANKTNSIYKTTAKDANLTSVDLSAKIGSLKDSFPEVLNLHNAKICTQFSILGEEVWSHLT